MGQILILSVILMFAPFASAKLDVVTSTTDLAALVEAVAQNDATVFSIVKGTQDPHQIEAKPSFMVRMRNADIVIAQGLELETAWLKPLIDGARNPKINMSGHGYLELGDKLDPLDVAHGAVSRASGDVHPSGNPHFQVDPIRMGQAAVIIAERMGELDAAHAEAFKKNAEEFQKNLEKKTVDWQARIKKTGIKEFVTYHKSMEYFANRFGLKADIQLEPKPGIPPTLSHLLEVITEIKKRKINLVLIENYFDEAPSEKLKTEVPSLRIVRVPISVLGEPKIKTTEQLIENFVRVFEGK